MSRSAGLLHVAATIAEIRSAVAAAKARHFTVGFVPTMGALHAGHASLIRTARSRCGYVAVSIFVNPTQFGPGEDFERYPRTFESDLQMCHDAGADVVFAPSVRMIYPESFSTQVEVTGLTDVLEGAVRRGHFRGVTTVVLKLFNIVSPDLAFFGAKDFQQQLVIRRMVADLNVPVGIVTLPTVREPDGLAMSSRNRYLTPAQREQARSLSAALFSARDRLLAGTRDLRSITEELSSTIESAGLTVDYATARDPDTLLELAEPAPKMVLLVAARLGSVRLIDNLEVSLNQDAP